MNAAGFMDAGTSVLRLIALSIDIADAVYKLCGRYRRAKVRLHGLIVQMIALRAALDQIKALAIVERNAGHPPLRTDFGICLALCDDPLEHLHHDIDKLTKDTHLSEPAFLLRLKTAFSDGPVADTEAMLCRQTTALSLLLTAHSSQMLQQQNERLQRSQLPEAQQDLASDTASLRGLRDCQSIFSQSTDLLSNLSREFAFDSAVLGTAPYATQSRSLIALLQKRLQRDSSGFRCAEQYAGIDPWLNLFGGSPFWGNEETIASCKKSRRDVVLEWYKHGHGAIPALCDINTLIRGTNSTALNKLIKEEKKRERCHDRAPIQSEYGVYLCPTRTASPYAGSLLVAESALPPGVFNGEAVIYILDLARRRGEVEDSRLRLMRHFDEEFTPRCFRYFFTITLTDPESPWTPTSFRQHSYHDGETIFLFATCRWGRFAAQPLDCIQRLWNEATFEYRFEFVNVDAEKDSMEKFMGLDTNPLPSMEDINRGMEEEIRSACAAAVINADELVPPEQGQTLFHKCDDAEEFLHWQIGKRDARNIPESPSSFDIPSGELESVG
ncbi:hypothetical protein PWT90_04578 [Aphanocladium album]|nr:hypothetical protein PWT90_04578 [Aphanocladium album]